MELACAGMVAMVLWTKEGGHEDSQVRACDKEGTTCKDPALGGSELVWAQREGCPGQERPGLWEAPSEEDVQSGLYSGRAVQAGRDRTL